MARFALLALAAVFLYLGYGAIRASSGHCQGLMIMTGLGCCGFGSFMIKSFICAWLKAKPEPRPKSL